MAGRSRPSPAAVALGTARRRLVLESAGIVVSVFAFGVVYGIAARDAGLMLPEAVAMSVFVFAGSSQFVAAGLVAQGATWPAIVLLTALINARHLLYSSAMLPWLRTRPPAERAVMAYGLTDEAFALSIHHFGRVGRVDPVGYWLAVLVVWVPWNVATIVGVVGGGAVPDPGRLGLDVVFPAAMAGLAALLIHGRRDVVAAAAGVAIGIALGLAVDPAVGIVAGGLGGPLVALLLVPGEPGPPTIAADGHDPIITTAP